MKKSLVALGAGLLLSLAAPEQPGMLRDIWGMEDMAPESQEAVLASAEAEAAPISDEAVPALAEAAPVSAEAGAARASVEAGLEEETANEIPEGPEISAPSALLMEASTGQVIYEKNADKQRSPASITKIMTLILIFDAIDSGKIKMDDEVVTSAYAKSMGGSQVFLEGAVITGRKYASLPQATGNQAYTIMFTGYLWTVMFMHMGTPRKMSAKADGRPARRVGEVAPYSIKRIICMSGL